MTAPSVAPVEREAPTREPIKHAHCILCQRGPGEVRTLCGGTKPLYGPLPPAPAGRLIPVEACVVCADLLYAPCDQCGGRAW